MGKEYGVIGFPVGHSMSPFMHNDAFSQLGIDAIYRSIQIEPAELEVKVKELKENEIAGFNVTMPHKVAIMNYLDEVDEVAKSIGAVNTVVLCNGKYKGYNTDGLGFVKGIVEQYGSLQDKRILLVGAGGACRAIFHTLASLGIESVDIANRTIEKAEQLKEACSYPVQSKVISLETAEQRIEKYDMIVNTTTVGMLPRVNEKSLSLKGIKKNSIVADIVYNPLETLFLKEAKQQGASIQNGLPMFVYQGAIAFELWTGQKPDVKRMTYIVEQQLKK